MTSDPGIPEVPNTVSEGTGNEGLVTVVRGSTLRLFPTLLNLFMLHLEAHYFERLVAFVLKLHSEAVQEQGRGAADEWISDSQLHEEEVFRDLVQSIESLATESQRQSGLVLEGIAVTSMWAFVQRGRVLRDLHSHHNAYWSGVFYLMAPRGAGVISFVDPLQHFKVIQPLRRPVEPERPEVLDSICAINIQPEPGLLLLFPAWLYHSIGPSESDDCLRVSVAFNLMPTGAIGGPTGRFTYSDSDADSGATT